MKWRDGRRQGGPSFPCLALARAPALALRFFATIPRHARRVGVPLDHRRHAPIRQARSRSATARRDRLDARPPCREPGKGKGKGRGTVTPGIVKLRVLPGEAAHRYVAKKVTECGSSTDCSRSLAPPRCQARAYPVPGHARGTTGYEWVPPIARVELKKHKIRAARGPTACYLRLHFLR